MEFYKNIMVKMISQEIKKKKYQNIQLNISINILPRLIQETNFKWEKNIIEAQHGLLIIRNLN